MAAPPEGDHAVRARSCITGRLFLGLDSECKGVSFMTFNEHLVYRAFFFQSMIHFYKIFVKQIKKKSHLLLLLKTNESMCNHHKIRENIKEETKG